MKSGVVSKADGFAGWRVLITGGSSGIGLALARQLVQAGAHVALAARDQARLGSAVEQLRQGAPGGQIICAVSMDVTSADSVAAGTAAALTQLGGLDLLVNNAGFAIAGYVDQLGEQDYAEMIAVNYLGPVRVIRALLPHFMAQRSGHIVNVTSMLGFMGTFGYGAYAASKFALSGYTECLRQELRGHGVAVHLCYPPTTETPGLERENITKPPESWAIEGKSKVFQPDQVARAMVRGVRRGDFHILVGLDSWFIWLMNRLFPWLVRWFTDGVLRRHQGNPTR